jgi:hypothetical protein
MEIDMNRTRLIRTCALMVLFAGSTLLADIYSPTVSISVTPPTGKAIDVAVRESEVGHFKVGSTEYDIRPTITDAKPWNAVTVTIFKAATATAPSAVLAEVDVKTGGPAVATKSNPVFKVAVTKVTAAPNPAEKK